MVCCSRSGWLSLKVFGWRWVQRHFGKTDGGGDDLSSASSFPLMVRGGDVDSARRGGEARGDLAGRRLVDDGDNYGGYSALLTSS